MNDEQLDRLLVALERNQVTVVGLVRAVEQQCEQIGLLVQSVAMLLGEELGAPEDEDAEPERLDMDGKPY